MTRQQWLGFLALCLLGASAWLVEGAWPSLIDADSRECLHYGSIALAVGVFGWNRIARRKLQTWRCFKLGVASICLLGLPAALLEHTRSGLSQGSSAALFALLPVAVVLLVPHFDLGNRLESDTTRLLAPALIGLAGTLFLLPFSLPATVRETRSFAVVILAVLIAASASVWMYRLLVEVRVVEAVMTCCLANAMFLLILALGLNEMGGPTWGGQWNLNAIGVETLKALCFDMPRIGLLLWLMREVAPERLAARALVVPMLTVLEGFALVRPQITFRSVMGAILLTYGAWRLLTGKQHEEEPRLMLS